MDFNKEQIEQLHSQLKAYLGKVVCEALEDATVTEVKCSEDGFIWVMQHGKGWVNTQGFLPEHQRLQAINLMASLLGKQVYADCPDLSGELPNGDRVSASVWPSGAPSFFIRRHAPEVFTFGDYLTKGILEPWHVEVLLHHIHGRSNIVFSGATSSGKTTLLNTCLAELKDSSEHVVVIEDTKEIQVVGKNFSRFYTSAKVSMQQQIMTSMRRKPDRLIIGETRDKAGLDLLRAWQTGHGGGMSTVHANSAAGVFERFAQFCEEAGTPPQWRLMQATIDVVVHMEMTPQGRRVQELMEVQHDETLSQIPIRLKQLGSNSQL